VFLTVKPPKATEVTLLLLLDGRPYAAANRGESESKVKYGGYHNMPYLVSPGPWLKGKDGIPGSALVGRVPAHHEAVRGESTSTLPAHLTKILTDKNWSSLSYVTHFLF
jgi:hypothetical protein